MRLTKIYTKIGDKGRTMLASGEKVPKTSARIEAYGTVDELNAFVGLLNDTLKELPAVPTDDLQAKISIVQNELFDVGGELATPQSVLDTRKQKVVDKESIARLEQEIDAFNEKLPPLANFVLPGGHKANAMAHVARTVCRRAERQVWRLKEVEPTIRDEVVIYLNRLSDWFFVMGREICGRTGTKERLWQQERKGSLKT